MRTLPLHIRVQWAWAREGQVFSPSAFSPNMGGSQRIDPRGGDRLLTSISWQSSVKPGNHEVLLHLVCSPAGQELGEGGEISLLSAHHISEKVFVRRPDGTVIQTIDGPSTMITKSFALGGDGLLLPADYIIWVYGEGGGNPHAAPVEVQTSLYVTDLPPAPPEEE